MQASATLEEAPSRAASWVQPTVIAVLLAISFSHLLNDTIQALIPSIYPLLRESYHLTFAQLGWITFTFQCTASLFQPLATERFQAAHAKGVPAVRPSTGREAAMFLLALAGPESDWIFGQMFLYAGGWVT